jgi:hypothetical protein
MTPKFHPHDWNQTYWADKSARCRKEEEQRLEDELKQFLKHLTQSGSYRLDGHYRNA